MNQNPNGPRGRSRWTAVRDALSADRTGTGGGDAESVSPRMTVLVMDSTQARVWERAAGMAGPGVNGRASGSFGVQFWSWADVAQEVVDLLAECPLSAATGADVAAAVAGELRDRDVSGEAWLRLSKDHPESWVRLASAIQRGASGAAESVDADAVSAFEPGAGGSGLLADAGLDGIAGSVRDRLSADGLALAADVAVMAAGLVRAHPAVLARLLGRAFAIGDEVPPGYRAIHQALRTSGILTEVDIQARAGSVIESAGRDAVERVVAVLPDAQSEARLAANTAYRWLKEPEVLVDDVTLIIPDRQPYLPVLIAELDRFGVPWWSPHRSATCRGTRAGRAAAALARCLDGRQPCLQCSTGTPGHDCTGEFRFAAEVVCVLADQGLVHLVLAAARALVLTGGLRNWARLLDWLAGDDDALPHVSQKQEQLLHQSEEATGAVRDRLRRGLIDRVDPADEDRLAALSSLSKVLAPEQQAPSTLAGRIVCLAELCEESTCAELRTIAGGLPVAHGSVHSQFDLLRPVLDRPVDSETNRPGGGVTILSAADVAAVTSPRIIWLGLAEGVCPASSLPDPLVIGHDEAVSREQARVAAAAAPVVADATHLLLTIPRVRIGTRSAEVASSWVLDWAATMGLGAHELVSGEDPAKWRLKPGWEARSYPNGLEVLRATPAPAAAAESGASGGTGVSEGGAPVFAPLSSAAETIRRLSPDVAPVGADGILGALGGQPDTWLAARGRPSGPLSYSAVKDYLECPRRFLWQRVAGIRVPEDPSVDQPIPAHSWGTAVHDAVEHSWVQLVAAAPADRRTLLADQIRTEVAAQMPFVDLADPRIIERVERQADAVVSLVDAADVNGASPWTAAVPEFERPLAGEIAGLSLNGFADLAWPGVIVDLKTGAPDSSLTKAVVAGEQLLVGADPAPEPVVIKALQVGLYAALDAEGGLDSDADDLVAAEFWHVKPGKGNRISLQLPVRVTPDDWRRQALSRVRSGLASGLFPAVGDPTARFNGVCSYCDFKVVCGPETADRWAEIGGDPIFDTIRFQPDGPHVRKQSGNEHGETNGDAR